MCSCIVAAAAGLAACVIRDVLIRHQSLRKLAIRTKRTITYGAIDVLSTAAKSTPAYGNRL